MCDSDKPTGFLDAHTHNYADEDRRSAYEPRPSKQATEEAFSISEERQANLVFVPNYKIEPAASPGLIQVTNTEYGFNFQYPSELDTINQRKQRGDKLGRTEAHHYIPKTG